MMQSRWAYAVAIGLAALGSPATADDLAIFVRAGKLEAPDRKEAGPEGVSLDDLSNQRQAMEDAYKKQFGKKREKWPPEKLAEFDALAARVQRRAFETNYRNYASGEAKDGEQSAAGLRDNLAKKKGVRVASSAAEADFDVEVVGRYTGPDESGTRAAHIGLRIKPGGRLDTAMLAKSPLVWPENVNKMYAASAVPWHQYSAESPYWLVEVERQAGVFGGMVYGKTEEHAANSFEKLAKENLAGVAAVRRAAH